MMPCGTGSGEHAEEQKQINYEYFNRLCDVAEEYGITICFENLPFPALPINNCRQILDFVKWINRDCFKVCLDTGHALVTKEQPGEAVRMIGKEYLRTLHVHDNDGTGDYHQLPGTGIGDWEDFGRALNEIGFDGALSLETMVRGNDLSPEEWDAQARALAATAKRISEYR
jgi:sugar phosphate isomerase/epimerase